MSISLLLGHELVTIGRAHADVEAPSLAHDRERHVDPRRPHRPHPPVKIGQVLDRPPGQGDDHVAALKARR